MLKRDNFSSNKTALVTGASRGIGASICTGLYNLGYNIIMVSKNAKRLHDFSKNFDSARILPIVCDFSNPENIDLLCNKITTNPSLVICNAGISSQNLIQDESLDNIYNVLNVNLISHIYLLKKLVPNMISNKSGLIVNISSVLTTINCSNEIIYTISKYGMEALTKGLGYELEPSNINSIAFRLGFVDTDMNSSFTQEDLIEIKNSLVNKTIATPKQVSDFILDIILNNKFKNKDIIDVPFGWIK